MSGDSRDGSCVVEGELGKRKAPCLFDPSVTSVDEVAMWLEGKIDEGGCGKVSAEAKLNILRSVRENEVDREVLATLTDCDIKEVLGVAVLGQRFFCDWRAVKSLPGGAFPGLLIFDASAS